MNFQIKKYLAYHKCIKEVGSYIKQHFDDKGGGWPVDLKRTSNGYERTYCTKLKEIPDYMRLYQITPEYNPLHPSVPKYTRLHPIIPDYNRVYSTT